MNTQPGELCLQAQDLLRGALYDAQRGRYLVALAKSHAASAMLALLDDEREPHCEPGDALKPRES